MQQSHTSTRTQSDLRLHGDVKYHIGSPVSNTVVTVYGARWGLEISGGILYMIKNYAIHLKLI